MSDLIFYTNGEETYRIPFPTPGTKCPEMKLEIKMTETDISKVLIEGDYATIMGVKYKRVEEPKTPVEEAYKEVFGKYPELETDSKYDDIRWRGFQAGFQAAYEEKVREDDYYNEVITQKNTEPQCPDEPEYYDEVEWDEKDNPKPMDEVVNRLVRKYEAQKLFNRLVDELGYDFDACNDVVDLVEDWLPKEQSAAGSQNVNTELLVDGFNHCLKKIKEMLR
jgi:hypothetical protein